MFNQKNINLLKPPEKPRFSINTKPEIPSLPIVEDKTRINVKYPLIPPYSYAHIYWDDKDGEVIYKVVEPALSEEEKRILGFLEEGIKELINISFIGVKEGETVIKYLEQNIDVLLAELGITVTKDSYLKIMYYIYRNFIGMNQIEPFLCDYFIEDIECNGAGFPIYLVHRKYRNLRTNVQFGTTDELTSFIEKLAQKCGKYISYAEPLLDGSLPDGSRVNATFSSDISSRGPTFTIRKFTKIPWTPTKLLDLKTISPEMLAYLWILIENESNIMIIGGTGSGKTTLLNGLAFFVPPQARIVSIEDTRELNLLHKNWLPSVARQGLGLTNLTGQRYGEVTLFDLLKESFRQRPDYVIVGEIRGAEAYVLFQGMASGHPSFGTMHANSIETMIRRLETPPINLSGSLVNSLDVVCVIAFTKVKGKEARKVRQIIEIIDIKDNGEIRTNVPFVWNPNTDSFFFKTQSYIFNKLYVQHGITPDKLQREFRIRTQLLIKMYQNKIFDFKEVQEIINQYYKTPGKVLRRFSII